MFSNIGGRPRPLAPTCNVCLIRDNFTTIWCEVTSSIRTRSLNEENEDTSISNGHVASSDKRKVNSAEGANFSDAGSDDEQVKELLLCLRPICDGKNVEEKVETKSGKESPVENEVNLPNKEILNENQKNRPMKKRLLPKVDENESCKKPMVVKSGSEAEKSVVESLILMSSHKM